MSKNRVVCESQSATTEASAPANIDPLTSNDHSTEADSLRERLIAIESEIVILTPPNERFAAAWDTTDVPSALQSYLVKLLGSSDAFSVVCRSNVCKITIDAASKLNPDWLRNLQTDPDRERILDAIQLSDGGVYLVVRSEKGD